MTMEGERMPTANSVLKAGTGVLAQLPEVLQQAHAEIRVVLETLRQSRGFLERTTFERVQRTQRNLQAVSSATEQAATDMLDGLDRALLLIDRLDNSADPALSGVHLDTETADEGAIRTELRDELFHLISSLQFQDITSQQLRYASGVLDELEERLLVIADLFDVSLADLDAETELESSRDAAFDPAASVFGSEERQSVADEIFGSPAADDTR